jgi:hypothetical protein
MAFSSSGPNNSVSGRKAAPKISRFLGMNEHHRLILLEGGSVCSHLTFRIRDGELAAVDNAIIQLRKFLLGKIKRSWIGYNGRHGRDGTVWKGVEGEYG